MPPDYDRVSPKHTQRGDSGMIYYNVNVESK